jgi:lipopolysaccharide export system protein LptC
VLQRPRFTQYTVNKPYTQIEGLRGYISSNGEEVELVDNVKVVRQAFEGKGEMQVLTEKLWIFPKQDLVKTNAPVTIKQAPKTVITAVGMVYDKKAQTVSLLDRVKVHYERPATVKAIRAVKTAKASKIKAKKVVNNQSKKVNADVTKNKVKPKPAIKKK